METKLTQKSWKNECTLCIPVSHKSKAGKLSWNPKGTDEGGSEGPVDEPKGTDGTGGNSNTSIIVNKVKKADANKLKNILKTIIK